MNNFEPKDRKFAQSKFLCYNTTWDNHEKEKLSPWDMDIITDSFGKLNAFDTFFQMGFAFFRNACKF